MTRTNMEKIESNRRTVNFAAGTLFTEPIMETEYANALSLVNDWRASHIRPLISVFEHAQESKEGIKYVAITPRIKRLPAIKNKMTLQPSMKLTQMQDIAGCRAVMNGIENVKKMVSDCEVVKRGRLLRRKIKKVDYIDNPRSTGYRGIHLIYQFNSRTYGDLKIEMQLRTWDQHAWATAVEAVGLDLGQDLKSGQGDQRWLDFFRLMGSVLALRENTPLVEGTPNDRFELYQKLMEHTENLKVIARLQSIISMSSKRERALTRVRKFLADVSSRRGSSYFLLELNEISLRIRPYISQEKAWHDYIGKETKIRSKSSTGDVVLVAADSIYDLRRNYSNYFANVKKFKSDLELAIRTRLGPQFVPSGANKYGW